jgi:two-component system chemotaxis response regulator CheB
LDKIKVLVIDDSAFNRRTLAEILSSSSDIEVVGVASNGEEGLKKMLELEPDVVTVDLEMPIMDGFTFIRMTMATSPVPMIVISSKKDEVNVFKAMDLGAVDFIAKPTTTISEKLFEIKAELLEKVRAASQTSLKNVKHIIDKFRGFEKYKKKPADSYKAFFSPFDFDAKEKIEVLAIGSSTGGPTALKSLFNKLPVDLDVAVVVSQHMPEGFTASFAQRLNESSRYIIKEAGEGDILEKGKVLVAPGGDHLLFGKSGKNVYVKLKAGKVTDNNVPSVNNMFKSISEIFKSKVLGVVLTGMGADGKEGVLNIKNSGGRVIAESERTAVIFGMPNEAIKTGKVDKVAPLDNIADTIVEICTQSKKK